MELERVIEILENHQMWRRDQNVPPKVEMQSPTEIGAAIDYALSELKKLRLGVVSKRFYVVQDEDYDMYSFHKTKKGAEKELERRRKKDTINYTVGTRSFKD